MTTRGLRTRSWMAAAIMLCVLAASASVASADQITVLCSNGFKAVLQDLAPQFEKATKHEVVIRYSVSAELKRRIEGGEVFDVAILTPGLIDDLIKTKRIAADSRAPLARSGFALAIRRGAHKPDVRDVESLKATLLASQSIAFAKEGSGGVYLMAREFDALPGPIAASLVISTVLASLTTPLVVMLVKGV